MLFPAIRPVEAFADGATFSVGSIPLTGRLTAGHSPVGTTRSWVSC